MSRGVRFIHAADLHLDAPFAGVDATDDRVREALVESTYRALDRLVALCVEREVDFLVVAGDLYNSRDRSLRSQFAFQAAAERLSQAGVEVYVARGNHDPEDGWSAGLELPSSVRFFPADRVGRFEVARDGETLCALYGRSFGTAAVTEDLAAGFEREAGDAVAIGVLHANVGGRPEHEPYAPATMDDLRAARMDYWALGHIHKPETLAEEPRIAYSGSTQGLNPKESGSRGCELVEIDGGSIRQESLETCAVVWDQVRVDVAGMEGLGALRDALRSGCEEVRGSFGGKPAIVRIDLAGRGAVHRDVAHGRALADLLDDVREEELSRDPWVWVDRLRDRTAPDLDLEAFRLGEDLASDLVRAVDGLLEDEEAARELVAEVLAPVRERVGDVWTGSPRDVLERARDVCLDRFGAEDV